MKRFLEAKPDGFSDVFSLGDKNGCWMFWVYCSFTEPKSPCFLMLVMFFSAKKSRGFKAAAG